MSKYEEMSVFVSNLFTWQRQIFEFECKETSSKMNFSELKSLVLSVKNLITKDFEPSNVLEIFRQMTRVTPGFEKIRVFISRIFCSEFDFTIS